MFRGEPFPLRLYADVADAAYQIICKAFAFHDGDNFDGIGLVVGPENELLSGDLDILHRTSVIPENGVHVDIAFAIRLQRVVMAIDERCGPGQETRVHAHAFACIDLNHHETLPVAAIAFDLGAQLLKKCFFELDDLFDVHIGEERMGCGDGAFGEENVLKLIVAGRENGSALVDFGGVKKIEDGEMLNGENAIHALQTETALAVQEIGDVRLLESSLLGEAEAGEIAVLNALPKSVAKIFLEDAEFHRGEYSTGAV